MKKLVSMLLAALMLLGCCAAFAEEEAPFTFRGLRWGMTPEEVAMAESKSFTELEADSYTTVAGTLDGLKLSRFENVRGSYVFVNNGLASVAMDVNLWDMVDAEEIEYLRQALCIVYGEVDETLALPENVQKFLTSSESLALASWQPVEGSCIVLLSNNGWCHLLYMDATIDLVTELQTVAPTPTPEPINIFGL